MHQAAVLIGQLPVGPKCARRAGLIALANRKSGLVFPAHRIPTNRRPDPQTLDLFEETTP